MVLVEKKIIRDTSVTITLTAEEFAGLVASYGCTSKSKRDQSITVDVGHTADVPKGVEMFEKLKTIYENLVAEGYYDK